jgi:hypothetical protein
MKHLSLTTWEWPNPKGGEAWNELLDLLQYGNYAINITRRFTVMKDKNAVSKAVSPLSKVLDNNVEAEDNTNKESTMDAASGTVTLTAAEYNALVAKSSKKPGQQATTCQKKWKCVMKRKEIVLSGATPQMQQIMQCVAQESKANPEVEFHDSQAIIDRLMDEDNADAMTFSKTYRDASDAVRLVRCVKVMNYYSHPDFRVEMTDTFDVR